MGSYSSTVIQCPFYHDDDQKTRCIICEGILPGSRSIKHQFVNGESFRRQMKMCTGNYMSCHLAKMFYRIKYKE